MFGIIEKMVVLLTNIVNNSNHTKYVSLSNEKCMAQPTLINYILMNSVKNFTTIHSRLDYIDVLEVVIL